MPLPDAISLPLKKIRNTRCSNIGHKAIGKKGIKDAKKNKTREQKRRLKKESTAKGTRGRDNKLVSRIPYPLYVRASYPFPYLFISFLVSLQGKG